MRYRWFVFTWEGDKASISGGFAQCSQVNPHSAEVLGMTVSEFGICCAGCICARLGEWLASLLCFDVVACRR